MNGDVVGKVAYTQEDGLRMRTNEVLHEFDFELQEARRLFPPGADGPPVLPSMRPQTQATRGRLFSISVARVAARLAKIGAV